MQQNLYQAILDSAVSCSGGSTVGATDVVQPKARSGTLWWRSLLCWLNLHFGFTNTLFFVRLRVGLVCVLRVNVLRIGVIARHKCREVDAPFCGDDEATLRQSLNSESRSRVRLPAAEPTSVHHSLTRVERVWVVMYGISKYWSRITVPC